MRTHSTPEYSHSAHSTQSTHTVPTAPTAPPAAGCRLCSGIVFWPTGDIDADMERIRAFYAGMKGKYPHLQGDIKVRE